jgi:purine-binding chemotaxis protein CheW
LTQPAYPPSVSAQIALVIRIGESLHAVPIEAVVEVLPALPIERLPQCPDFVAGVVFVRGHVIPVLSAAERLELRDYDRPSEPHIVCLRVGDRLVGLEVDEALELVDLRQGVRLDAREVGVQDAFFSGVLDLDGKLLRILNPARLLDDDETAVLGEC